MQIHAYSNFCLSMMQKKNIASEKAYFESKDNPSCIDLFITSSPNSLQNTSTTKKRLSDFHKMVIAILKVTFLKSKSKVITYIDIINSLMKKNSKLI